MSAMTNEINIINITHVSHLLYYILFMFFNSTNLAFFKVKLPPCKIEEDWMQISSHKTINVNV
jgi:hypothetical protein